MNRGNGRVYRQATSRFWWIQFSVGGRVIRQSTGTENKTQARKILRAKLAEVDQGKRFNPAGRKLTVDDLLDGLVKDHEAKARKGVKVLKYQLAPVRRALGHFRAQDVTRAMLKHYRDERRKAGKKPATCNKEVAWVRTAFQLAVDDELLDRMPSFKDLRLPENNVREGFVEPHAFEAVLEHLPDAIADLVTFSYMTAWRRGEVLSLTWDSVDLAARTLRLPAASSKNSKARFMALDGELHALILKRWEKRVAVENEHPGYVFHRGDGNRIRDFSAAWKRACEAAGQKGLLVHDLRRSGVRNLLRSRVDADTAMKVSGHRTTAMLTRYNIIDEMDVEDAMQKVQAYVAEKRKVKKA